MPSKPKTIDGTYYTWRCGTPHAFSKTPKQLRIPGTRKTHCLKPSAEWNNLDNTLHTYTFADGTTRQWFFTPTWRSPRERSPTLDSLVREMKRQLGRDLADDVADTTRLASSSDFHFVAHPDDKVFYRTRLAQVVLEGRDIIFPRVYYGEKMTHPVMPVVICETWVKWGQMDLLLDDGLRRWTTAYYEESIFHVAPRRFLPLREFRSSPHTNPFDDPFEPELKEIRDKQNAWHEELAQKAFHPARVERMMETYGEDWMERV